jgi:hypothetical protein
MSRWRSPYGSQSEAQRSRVDPADLDKHRIDPPAHSHSGFDCHVRELGKKPRRSGVLIDPNNTIESISARQTSAGQSVHHRERVIFFGHPPTTLSGPQPCPTGAEATLFEKIKLVPPGGSRNLPFSSGYRPRSAAAPSPTSHPQLNRDRPLRNARRNRKHAPRCPAARAGDVNCSAWSPAAVAAKAATTTIPHVVCHGRPRTDHCHRWVRCPIVFEVGAGTSFVWRRGVLIMRQTRTLAAVTRFSQAGTSVSGHGRAPTSLIGLSRSHLRTCAAVPWHTHRPVSFSSTSNIPSAAART